MFAPSHIATRRVTLDFSSSGQGSHPAVQLLADGRLLANAIDLIDWRDDPVQVRVCEECGTIRCATGGWLSFRRFGLHVLLIPAFSSLADDPAEFRPPDLVSQHGFILISASAFQDMRRVVNELPAHEALSPLSRREAALVLQAMAPGQVLGVFPSSPFLDSSRVVASDTGSPTEQVSALNTVLSGLSASSAEATPPLSSGSPVMLFLDLPGMPPWQPLIDAEGPCLLLAPGLAVSAA